MRTPVIGAAVALALLLSACGGGGETTVTVTEPAAGGSSQQQQQGSGVEINTGNGAVAGYVDSQKVEGEKLILGGWAATGDLSGPADKVAAQVGGKTLAEAVPTLPREDVVEALHKPGLQESGFELRLPIGSLACGKPAAGIKVLAFSGGKSGVLLFGEGIKAALTEAC
jgi:hypothetical protein